MKNQLLSLGNGAFNKGDYGLAIDLYEKSLVSYPELAKIIKGNITFAKRRLNNSSSLISSVDIIVPVFNALDDVKKCINSIVLNGDGFKTRVIIINDGSDELTTKWLTECCQLNSTFQLIEHEQNLGYTKAVNAGLKASTADYVIALNSDTIVTSGWLLGMIRCMRSAPEVGIVGPLSNAATWQNVPNLRDESGSFAVNALPSGYSVEDMAAVVRASSLKRYPKLPFVNGFCFMIKREVIEAIGFMDEENFPVGYGEENDYCIRASDAGFDLAIADDVFVYHAKSKSFGHDRRVTLSKLGTESLRKKHSLEKCNSKISELKKLDTLELIRLDIKKYLEVKSRPKKVCFLELRVLFLLPVSGGGGGVHSVVQEASEMRRLGMDACIGVPSKYVDKFLESYKEFIGAEKLFKGYEESTLIEIASGYDVIIGTIFTSMILIKRIVEKFPRIMPAYYVQDYEPLFFSNGSAQWKQAYDSYGLIPGTLLFAKTHWIINQVKKYHGLNAKKVYPSIDHKVYKPRERIYNAKINVAAMIRPKTPRRGAERTLRILLLLAKKFPEKISISIFGCHDDDPSLLLLNNQCEYKNYGILNRSHVAELLGDSDLFLDLSDYQAFGRTALEAMACGCASVVPNKGGVYEYAIHRHNAMIVDTHDDAACFSAIEELISDDNLLAELKRNGFITASKFSVHRSAVSEITAIFDAWKNFRAENPHIDSDELPLSLSPVIRLNNEV